MAHFSKRLAAAIVKKGNPVTVGLDPRDRQIPPDVLAGARQRRSSPVEQIASAFEEFCCRIIDVVAPLVPAVKPQAAFFEEWGPAGCAALARVISKARGMGLVVICDAKRGDIGTTAEAYARAKRTTRPNAGAEPASSGSPCRRGPGFRPHTRAITANGKMPVARWREDGARAAPWSLTR